MGAPPWLGGLVRQQQAPHTASIGGGSKPCPAADDRFRLLACTHPLVQIVMASAPYVWSFCKQQGAAHIGSELHREGCSGAGAGWGRQPGRQAARQAMGRQAGSLAGWQAGRQAGLAGG